MSLRAFRFRLPLTKPVTLGGAAVTHREGILLNEGSRWGEASPLPGFSRESIDDVIRDLKTGRCDSPSLRFAMDSLKFSQDAAVRVGMNALLQGEREDVVCNAKRLSKTVCAAVKLKVGGQDLGEQIDLVHKVREVLGGKITIRLDANRRWNYKSAVRFVERVRDLDIEYLEEPLDDPSRLEELYGTMGVPYALDETLAEGVFSPERFPNAAALVVKPTLLGGLARIEELSATGKQLVFSAAYESGVGIAQIARLAARFSPDVPAGLDTYSWLSDDVLDERLVLADWNLVVPANLGVGIGALQEIDLL